MKSSSKLWSCNINVFPFRFVFLQLYYNGLMPTDDSRPILLPTEQIEMHRSLKLLDLIKPCDTHKIGVLYVRKGQTQEQEILSNTFGSLRYMRFLYVMLWIPLYRFWFYRFMVNLIDWVVPVIIIYTENIFFREWMSIEKCLAVLPQKGKKSNVSGSGLLCGVDKRVTRYLSWRPGHIRGGWEKYFHLAWWLTAGEIFTKWNSQWL